MGETRVDLLHLLEDLRDAYAGPLEETILTEIVANALDGGAGVIRIVTDPTAPSLTVVDDGRGMTRRELARFHDLAASSKERGRGIGFAGVGIKLGLLAAGEVRTETRKGTSHVMTTWAMSSRRRAPWRWLPPDGMLSHDGTAVRLGLESPFSPLVDPGFVERTIRRQFAPLFDPIFTETLGSHYPKGVRFAVNGRELGPERPPGGDRVELAIRLARKRKPAAVGWLVRSPVALPEGEAGIAISTYGKVIVRGWDWLGVTPAEPGRFTGLIEAPGLAGSLTLNKADFLRSGARGSVYLAYRKALQEIVNAQLAAWGDQPAAADRAHRRLSRPLERDLERVLADLSRAFPMLSALVETRPGGQRRLPMGDGSGGGAPSLTVVEPGGELEQPTGSPPEVAPADGAAPDGQESPPGPHDEPSLGLPGKATTRRPARYGLSIRFESRSDQLDLARLVETTVWVNEAHPAYQRAVDSRSEGYHLALATAMALAPLASEIAAQRGFVTAFLAEWGRSAQRKRAGRRK